MPIGGISTANDCGLRNLTLFLHRSGLDEVLAPSFGAQQAFAARLETLLAEYGREEEQRLARARSPDGVWGTLTEPERVLVETRAAAIATSKRACEAVF